MSTVRRYPVADAPFCGVELEVDIEFADIREDLLLSFLPNTARCYWSDLDDAERWFRLRDRRLLAASTADFVVYIDDLRRDGYSPSTLRRRWTAFRHLQRAKDRCRDLFEETEDEQSD